MAKGAAPNHPPISQPWYDLRNTVVPEAGLEPARSKGTLDFESSASTNSTTPAPEGGDTPNPVDSGVCGRSSGDVSHGAGESQAGEKIDKMTAIAIFPALRIWVGP